MKPTTTIDPQSYVQPATALFSIDPRKGHTDADHHCSHESGRGLGKDFGKHGKGTILSGTPSRLARSSWMPTLLPPSAGLEAESTNSNQAQTDLRARPRCMPEAKPARSGALQEPETRAQRPDMLSRKNVAAVCSRPLKSRSRASNGPKSSAAMICVLRSWKACKWLGKRSVTAPRQMPRASQRPTSKCARLATSRLRPSSRR